MFMDLPEATDKARTFTLYVHAAAAPTDETAYTIWDDDWGTTTFTPESAPVLVAAGVYEVGTIGLDASDSSSVLTVYFTGDEVSNLFLTTARLELHPSFASGDGGGYYERYFDSLPGATGQARLMTLYAEGEPSVESVFDNADGDPTFTPDPSGPTSIGGGWYELGTIMVGADDDSSLVSIYYTGSTPDFYLAAAEWGPHSATSATFSDLPVATYQARTFTLYVQTTSDEDGYGGLSGESYEVSDTNHMFSDGEDAPSFASSTIVSLGGGWYEVGTVTLNQWDPSSTVTIGYAGGADVTDASLATVPLSLTPDGTPMSGALFNNLPQSPGQARSYTVYAESPSGALSDDDSYEVWDSATIVGTSDFSFTPVFSATTPLGQNWYEVATVALGADDTSSTITVGYDGSDLTNFCLLQQQTSAETYTSTGLVSTETDADGNTTTLGYDAIGEQTSETGPAVSTGPDGAMGTPVTTDVDDAIGRPTAEFDPLGNITAYAYQFYQSGNGLSQGESTTTTLQGQELPLSESNSADFQNLTLPNSEAGTYRSYNVYAYSATPLTSSIEYWVNAPGLDRVPASFSSVTPLGNDWYCLGTAEFNSSADNTSMTVSFSEPAGWSGSAPTLPTEIALLQAVLTNTYDANQNLLSETDAAGNTTTYAYSNLGLPCAAVRVNPGPTVARAGVRQSGHAREQYRLIGQRHDVRLQRSG